MDHGGREREGRHERSAGAREGEREREEKIFLGKNSLSSITTLSLHGPMENFYS